MGDPREVLTRSAPPPDATVRYGPGPDQVADVRWPTSPRTDGAALVVVIHGGFWMAEFDRAHAGPQSAGLADAGYAAATVDYRRVGQEGGGWPGTFDDVATLCDTVPALVAEAAGGRVDDRRVALVGHSAGGQLALWAAARHRLAPSSPWHRRDRLPVRGVVSLAGVGDLRAADRLKLGDDATRALLGGDETTHPERYAEASPAELLPLGVPAAVVHGIDDRLVPVEISRSFVERARAAGDQVELTELPGTGHFELIDPLTAAWPAVLAAVRSVLL